MIEKIIKTREKAVEERNELKEKINKLLVYISNIPASRADDTIFIVLREQVFYMKGYLRMLNDKITLLREQEEKLLAQGKEPELLTTLTKGGKGNESI